MEGGKQYVSLVMDRTYRMKLEEMPSHSPAHRCGVQGESVKEAESTKVKGCRVSIWMRTCHPDRKGADLPWDANGGWIDSQAQQDR